MDCQNAARVVYQVIDAEATVEIRTEVMAHLRECPECEKGYEIERRVKVMISRACAFSGCPEGLEERIRLAIEALEQQ